MNHIEKTKHLVSMGKVVICNPHYLTETAGQQERSLIGQRTAFLKFHRFMFDLQNSQIDSLWQGYKAANLQAQKDFLNEICCDLTLLCDAIQYQIALRGDNQADTMIAEEIAVSWHANVKLAEQFKEITSEHLISAAKEFLEYSH